MKIATRCICCDGTDLARSPAVLMPFVAHRVFGWEPAEITPAWNLRDLKAGHAYSLCTTLMCRQCDVLFLDMRFDDEEMAALYSDYRGPAYCATRERFEPGYVARNSILLAGSPYIAEIEKILAPHVGTAPRVLDWGGDTGLNTPFRHSATIHHVYDISRKPVVEGAVRVTRDQVAGATYDLVVSSNVLEHVPAPGAALDELVAVMQPNTVLYLEVPHEDVVRLGDVPEARLNAKRHWHEHINFFTAPSLDLMFRKAGLRTLERVSHPISAGGKQSHVFSIVGRLDR